MPDWFAPFHLPKFTDTKYDEQKAKYNRREGYTVTLPALDDIIKLKTFPPMTEQETDDWKNKRYYNIHPDRLAEIHREKERKRNKYLAMLKAPTPQILSSWGAIATALDDTQDALSTLACIGMITGAVLGGTAAAVLSGPVGWLAGGAMLLNLLNPMSRLKGFKGGAKVGRAAKKEVEKFSDKNPFSKKAAAKVAKRMKSFRPSVSNAIEALQVTAGIFGIGISIGPIMGFAQDLASGLVRKAMGQKVTFTTGPPHVPAHVMVAQKVLKGQAVQHGYAWKSDVPDEIASMVAANLALQVVEPYLQEWNAFDQVDDLANCLIQAPRPTDILTLEVISEMGYKLDDICNWPQNGQQWISLGDLQEATAPQAKENLEHFAESNKNSALAYTAGQNAHDFALGTIEAIEGRGQVYQEYSHIERIVIIILDNGWCYPDDITPAQVEKFEDWCYVHEYMNTQPNYKDIWRYAEVFCGFTWAKSPDEAR